MHKEKAVLVLIEHMKLLSYRIAGIEKTRESMDAKSRAAFRAIECALVEMGVDPNIIPKYPDLPQVYIDNYQKWKTKRYGVVTCAL